ncbi:MAG TPA: hypothetical protein VD735_02325, partial [Candidatus Saccharimonadales bacterium]|nr:hypothetical protein [Candidatus Saccharimonadales bacterium]
EAEPSLADLMLRYPDVAPTELPTLMGAMRNPTAGHRQDAWKRAKRRAKGGVRGYGLFKPGSGALS